MKKQFKVRSAIKICFQPSFSQLENALRLTNSMLELTHLNAGIMKPIFTINET